MAWKRTYSTSKLVKSICPTWVWFTKLKARWYRIIGISPFVVLIKIEISYQTLLHDFLIKFIDLFFECTNAEELSCNVTVVEITFWCSPSPTVECEGGGKSNRETNFSPKDVPLPKKENRRLSYFFEWQNAHGGVMLSIGSINISSSWMDRRIYW